MSSAALALAECPTISQSIPEQQDPTRRERPIAPVVRRRPTMEQGRALEGLGHAVEYLIDSYMFAAEPWPAAAHAEALHILKRASMAVFEDCQEVVPLWQKMERLISGRCFGSAR